MYVAISVVLSVGIILAYNYFTTSNTPTTSASSSDLPADVPIGTMVPYAGKDIPAGWLACNNASYPTTTYPELFAKIGYTYGMDDTKYRVPDTRGVFMRGIDATATRDTNRPAGSIQLSGTVPDTNSIFTGASATATGGVGYVPAPMAGQHNYVLTGSGGWSPGGPAFSAYLGRAQTVPNGPVTIVQYDTVEFDTAKCFNTSTYAYMPNVAGYYQVNAVVYYSSNSTTGMFQIYLHKNGGTHKRGPSIYNATNNQNVGISFSSIVAMNGTTDYIQIAVVASAGAPQVILNDSYLTWFNGAMLRPM